MKRLSLTNSIIIVNIAVFIVATILLSYNSEFIHDIALQPASIVQGKYLWTFLTSMFMHDSPSPVHLIVNMISLFFIGNLVERLIGTRRYLSLYLASGLFAGIFFVAIAYLMHANLAVYAVGASGAIFGLGGVLMFLTPDLPVYLMFIPVPIKMKYAMPIMLLALWALSLSVGLPIGNTAHLGGLLVGVFYGFYLRTKYKRKVVMINKYFK